MAREEWTELSLPRAVGDWIRAMSRRVGAPAHRVLRALLDDYFRRLPASSRRKVIERLRQHDESN